MSQLAQRYKREDRTRRYFPGDETRRQRVWTRCDQCHYDKNPRINSGKSRHRKLHEFSREIVVETFFLLSLSLSRARNSYPAVDYGRRRRHHRRCYGIDARACCGAAGKARAYCEISNLTKPGRDRERTGVRAVARYWKPGAHVLTFFPGLQAA